MNQIICIMPLYIVTECVLTKPLAVESESFLATGNCCTAITPESISIISASEQFKEELATLSVHHRRWYQP